MNILFITNHLNIGGITSYVLTLARGLKARGHKVYIASSGGSLLPEFMQEGIIYIPIPIRTKSEASPKILASLFKLKKAIPQNKIDILHSHSRTTQVLGCLLSRKTGIPHISTCHGFFKKRWSRKIFPCWGKKVIAISEQVRDHLRDDFKVEENSIRLIHNGIDTEKFKAQSEERKAQIKDNLGLGDGPVVGIVARLSDVKGHKYLIEAMNMVLKKEPGAQLLMVGEGREKKELVSLVQSLGMEKNVFFVSSVNDTKDLISIMDLFVMPSLKEGLGLSLMEAKASGLAVIGSDVGGIRSLIQNNSNGLLVRAADTAALSCAILELLQDPKRRIFLGHNARAFIKYNFSAEQMVSQTEEFYRECINT